MKSTTIVSTFAAFAVAAGLSAAVVPAAQAAGISFSSQNGQIVGVASGMKVQPKECSLSRKLTFEKDGPFYGSIDGGRVNIGQTASKGSTVVVRSKKLPRGWYDVTLLCGTTGEWGGQIIVSRSANVFNK